MDVFVSDVARSTEGAGGSSLMIILGLVGAMMLILALVSVLLYRNVITKITTAHGEQLVITHGALNFLFEFLVA